MIGKNHSHKSLTILCSETLFGEGVCLRLDLLRQRQQRQQRQQRHQRQQRQQRQQWQQRQQRHKGREASAAIWCLDKHCDILANRWRRLLKTRKHKKIRKFRLPLPQTKSRSAFRFCDGGHSKSGKVSVLGNSFAVRQLRQKSAITILSFYYLLLILSIILKNGAMPQSFHVNLRWQLNFPIHHCVLNNDDYSYY